MSVGVLIKMWVSSQISGASTILIEHKIFGRVFCLSKINARLCQDRTHIVQVELSSRKITGFPILYKLLVQDFLLGFDLRRKYRTYCIVTSLYLAQVALLLIVL